MDLFQIYPTDIDQVLSIHNNVNSKVRITPDLPYISTCLYGTRNDWSTAPITADLINKVESRVINALFLAISQLKC